jgi:hypothetical protein
MPSSVAWPRARPAAGSPRARPVELRRLRRYRHLRYRHTHPASAIRGHDADPAGVSGPDSRRLLVTGVALSIDNLAVGFALGTYHVSLVLAVVVIGAVSVILSLIGLELGDRLGARAGDSGELLGGIVLIGVGIAVATGLL